MRGRIFILGGALCLAGTAFAQTSQETAGATPAPANPPAAESAAPATPAPAAGAPSAAPVEAPKVAADNLPPPPSGKGQVVFFRKGGFVGSAISCAVREGQVKLSSLPPGRYFVQAADPGIHSFAVKSESTDTLRMEIEAGETYYAQCTISMGLMVGRPNLSPADRAVFFGMSAKLKPVEASVNSAAKAN